TASTPAFEPALPPEPPKLQGPTRPAARPPPRFERILATDRNPQPVIPRFLRSQPSLHPPARNKSLRCGIRNCILRSERPEDVSLESAQEDRMYCHRRQPHPTTQVHPEIQNVQERAHQRN